MVAKHSTVSEILSSGACIKCGKKSSDPTLALKHLLQVHGKTDGRKENLLLKLFTNSDVSPAKPKPPAQNRKRSRSASTGKFVRATAAPSKPQNKPKPVEK